MRKERKKAYTLLNTTQRERETLKDHNDNECAREQHKDALLAFCGAVLYGIAKSRLRDNATESVVVDELDLCALLDESIRKIYLCPVRQRQRLLLLRLHLSVSLALSVIVVISTSRKRAKRLTTQTAFEALSFSPKFVHLFASVL